MPHIALAQVFSRTASRAGLKLVMTQGFSPRAKISFAPELPAGVVALAEVVDMYFDEDVGSDLIPRMNAALPEGFEISRVIFPREDAPSLGKSCHYAEYLIRHAFGLDIAHYFMELSWPIVCWDSPGQGWFHFVIREPAQYPIGGFVKDMIKKYIIDGWQDVNIVRVAVGNEYSDYLNSVSMS